MIKQLRVMSTIRRIRCLQHEGVKAMAFNASSVWRASACIRYKCSCGLVRMAFRTQPNQARGLALSTAWISLQNDLERVYTQHPGTWRAFRSSRSSSMRLGPNDVPKINLPETSNSGARPLIAVAMSGGVDSSVAAWLLKEAGHDVMGIHMINWDEDEEKGMHTEVSGHCSSAQDLLDARRTCDVLGIPFKQVRFVREYWTEVFEPMVDLYMSGVTPNPDVACNREIKFKSLLQQAQALGAGLLATGHYARLRYSPHGASLLQARDHSKDQSYFLSAVPGSALAKAVFPLGDLLKEEVRQLAVRAALPSAHKRESMGLCFVGRRRFDHFLSNYIPDCPGPNANAPSPCATRAGPAEEQEDGQFVCAETGQRLGRHRGIHLYTIGQGARISGAKVGVRVGVRACPARRAPPGMRAGRDVCKKQTSPS